MGSAKTKAARKILRQEIKAQFEKEKVTVFPEIRTLVTAAKALKPAFSIFGFTVFKSKDVQTFAGYLTSWGEDGTLKPEVEAIAKEREGKTQSGGYQASGPVVTPPPAGKFETRIDALAP